ncbi:MAG: hypothetical protein JXA00_02050 [Candidatus Thermoplasmatota archaeon]|nr:hypothetical protein [Candidatus Thermoplasmatota archaeon]
MKVLCKVCKQEFDWQSNDIFMHPDGYTMSFTCRHCLKHTRAYQKGKLSLKS